MSFLQSADRAEIKLPIQDISGIGNLWFVMSETPAGNVFCCFSSWLCPLCISKVQEPTVR